MIGSVRFGITMNYSKNCGSERTRAELAFEEELDRYSDHIIVSKNKDLKDGTVTSWVYLDTEAQSQLPDAEKAISHFSIPLPVTAKEFENYKPFILKHVQVLHALLVKTGLTTPID